MSLSRIKTRRTTAEKEIDGGGWKHKGRKEVDLHKNEHKHDTAKPISVFIPLGEHTRMQKKTESRPASSKNKSLHFLDVLVALPFACAVSLLTNVTNAHPSPVISFAEGVLVPRNRGE